jgi:CoA:oxalate CoA-transferase
VRTLNPGLVYAAASGYGADGPWAARPGQDLLAQSVSGLTWVSGSDRPITVGLSLADHLMSCHLAEGVTALLVRKARTGGGGLVETSLLEGVLDLQFELLTTRLNDPTATPSRGPHSAHGYVSAPYGLYPTADGYLAIATTPVDQLGRLLGDDDLAAYDDSDRWWTERAQIERLIAQRLAAAGTEHWLELLTAAGVSCAPLPTLDELLSSPEFAALEMTQTVERPPAEPDGEPLRLTVARSPIRIDGEVLRSRRAAPRLGAQGDLRDGADPLADEPAI